MRIYIYMAILRDDHQQITRFLALAHIWIHVVEDCVSLRYTSSEQKVKIWIWGLGLNMGPDIVPQWNSRNTNWKAHPSRMGYPVRDVYSRNLMGWNLQTATMWAPRSYKLRYNPNELYIALPFSLKRFRWHQKVATFTTAV